MAWRQVAGRIATLGGRAVPREGHTTDNGNRILDVHELRIDDPQRLERELNQIAGVVANGLFACRPADVLLVGTSDGVRRIA
jgi:ribose 5-phosphate isomerase A